MKNASTSRILLELLEYGKWWLSPSPHLSLFTIPFSRTRPSWETAHADISKPPRATAPPAIVTQQSSIYTRA